MGEPVCHGCLAEVLGSSEEIRVSNVFGCDIGEELPALFLMADDGFGNLGQGESAEMKNYFFSVTH